MYVLHKVWLPVRQLAGSPKSSGYVPHSELDAVGQQRDAVVRRRSSIACLRLMLVEAGSVSGHIRSLISLYASASIDISIISADHW